MTKKELTFMPKLTCEYELDEFDILPKDYASFLSECAKIYVHQAYPDLKKDDTFYHPNFTILGKIEYSYPNNQAVEYHNQENQTENIPTGIYKTPSYWQNLGIADQLDVHQDDFDIRLQERVQQMNTQLDLRFADREGTFPRTYLKELDLCSESIKISARVKYDILPLRLYLSLNAEGGTIQEWRKKYQHISTPTLAITLDDQCNDYTKLESMVQNIELALKKRYPFERKKTTIEYTERDNVELAEKRRAQTIKAA